MQSLLDIILRLLGGDEDLKQEYEADPEGFANRYFSDLCGDDWNDLSLALDQSSVVQRDIDFSRSYDTGGNVAAASSTSEGDPSHSDEDSGHAVTQLHHIVNSYSYVDDRDTITDQSTNQVINTGGGDFWQSIDNDATTASGDGAVAAGDDINGDVNTGTIDNSDHSTDNSVDVSGDDNVVGDENVVGNSEDNSTVDVDVNVAGGDIDNSQDNSQDNDAVDIDDSFNDNSSDDDTTVTIDDHSDDDVVDDKDLVDVDDSFNDESVTTEDSFNDNSDNSVDQDGLININDTLSDNSLELLS